MSARRPRLVSLLALAAALPACAAPRPTEFVNVAFRPSVDTSHYATWRFDLQACQDFDDPRVENELVRQHMLEVIRDEIEQLGYRYVPEGPVDFLVHYELWIADEGGVGALSERGRGRILVRDVASGHLVWRGERKASLSRSPTDEERREQVRLFAHELLQYTHDLLEPD